MKILVLSLLLLCAGLATIGHTSSALAQGLKKDAADISVSLARLQNNPRYQGRILGTHLRRSGKGYVYEVRILRNNDSVIIVFIDPRTGDVISDTGSRGSKPRSKKKKNR
ncbi:MAG: PepSY domain-containing protein [Sneathiella sp.]